MNKLGVMVDISHVSDKTFYDALEVSDAPDDRLAFLVPRDLRCPAQYDRRHDQGARGQGRRNPN